MKHATSPDDDQLELWMQALSGRARSSMSAPAATSTEAVASWLHREVKRRESDQAANDVWEAKVLQHIREAGLYEPRTPNLLLRLRLATRGHRSIGSRALSAGAAALGIAALFLIAYPTWMAPDQVDPSSASELRGDGDSQTLRRPDPEAVGAEVMKVLMSHQLKSRRLNGSEGSIQIQAFVPNGHQARSELVALGIPVPDHGRLNLLILRSGKTTP